MDAANGNFRLRINSPCRNAGFDIQAPSSPDLDGNPRIVDGTVDMGAYEIQRTAILHVNAANGNDAWSGSSWALAKSSISNALSVAVSGGGILVADGEYGPIERTDNADILIQSMNGAATTLINGGGTRRCASLGPNATHTNIVLWGFTLTNGVAVASRGGGALAGTLVDCVLVANAATGTGGIDGGGGAHSSTLINCILRGNTARLGGGVYGATLVNCTLTGNTANVNGGGAAVSTLVNCLLTGNTAGIGGGAWGGAAGGTLRNCTVWKNTATSRNNGGGVVGGTVYNSIVWGNTNAGGLTNQNFGSENPNLYIMTFTNSCTTPLPPGGTGNIAADPRFVDAANGDFRLQYNSPCIDAGDNAHIPPGTTTDLAGNPRVMVQRVDMGAYEAPLSWVGPDDVPIRVPYSWLDNYTAFFGIPNYVTLAQTHGLNSVPLWESYLAHLDPLDFASRFHIHTFKTDGTRVTALDWAPRRTDRVYTVYGKTNLTDTAWHSPTNAATRFFKLNVGMP